MQWNALPKTEGCSSSAARRRFQEAGLLEWDELVGIEWEWQAMEGTMTKVPFEGAATGPARDLARQILELNLISQGSVLPRYTTCRTPRCP